jgi:hypothetical protein
MHGIRNALHANPGPTTPSQDCDKKARLHGLPISSGQAAGESLWSKGVLTSAVFRFLCATFALAALLLPISVSAHANHDASDEVGVQHQH